MINIKPFGSWKSPITTETIIAKTVGLGGVNSLAKDIYWLESRPQEKGRNVLVKQAADGTVADITPQPFNVRTRVHEYGGGAYLITEQAIYFSNYSDGRVYQQIGRETPQALTAESKKRYTDFVVDSPRNRLICVCEDHEVADSEPNNSIIAIALETGEITPLVTGSDFYTSPRISPDGTQLAYISWNHPSMPWDSSYLYLNDIQSDGSIDRVELVAGDTQESICEPKWSPDGLLYFNSDRNDWWNIYRRNSDGTIECLHEMAAEFTYPHWVFGLSTYSFISAELIVCAYSQDGSWHLGSINTKTKQFQAIDTPYTNISSVQASVDGDALFIAGSPNQPTAVTKFNLETQQATTIKRSGELNIDPGYLSIPQAISFPTDDNLIAHAWYYPPQNKDYTAPSGELPPVFVKSHGGPTAAAAVNLNLRIQYWTSRGFAYLDVNYGGSIGYGRQYRERLKDNWGIVDVRDCINAVQYLVEKQLADGERLVISGGSAGGYTTLAALTFYDTFKAGASYYGVSDLEILAKDTHKFEARYLDGLVGAYPEAKATYQERSPLYHIDRLSCPIIFFQGLEDKVVPPNQAEMMVEALKQKGLPVEYVTFPNEGHGFRQAANIKTAIESEFAFYSRVFDFETAD
ncbi:Dipeptidyl aminopeptidase/acylaminoacyl peptidase [Hyella patelloides LEGE 07179]|uniref:Dipeptidyl aminopeptidase/acylaminoacyl peptidase n=1 Tax=Hyella patelloides LEGE 07179 TaxID=945734 RepID=A0A563VTD6_9CYAN|nr:S9 family peptidase [Hyella patelloides]VEP14675.1 Dipeptidyl aminopeptidase/acylaminoacyl peptidase [Hyella patelloides LEGE 07179]